MYLDPQIQLILDQQLRILHPSTPSLHPFYTPSTIFFILLNHHILKRNFIKFTVVLRRTMSSFVFIFSILYHSQIRLCFFIDFACCIKVSKSDPFQHRYIASKNSQKILMRGCRRGAEGVQRGFRSSKWGAEIQKKTCFSHF